MNLFPFDRTVKSQIRKVVDFAHSNIFQVDDILDMMNDQMIIPGNKSEHLVLVPIGRWISYYLLEHPVHGRCHFFQIKRDASGQHLDKPSMEYIVKEFGVDTVLLDKHIRMDNITDETRIILPVDA